MNPAELPLRDVHLPGEIGWWPPAPGWWMLGLLVIASIVWAVRAWRRRRAWRRSPLRLAAAEFRRLRDGWSAHGNSRQLARDLSTWLRRTGMSLRSRREAASLTGAAWWGYLDDMAGIAVFGPDGGRLLTEAPYRASGEIDGDRMLTLCERWLRAVSDRQRRERA